MKAKTAEELILGIDFPLLKEQKKALLKLIEEAENKYGNPNDETVEDLTGILNLIDSIQDLAVDEYGKDENEVFDLHSDDEDEL